MVDIRSPDKTITTATMPRPISIRATPRAFWRRPTTGSHVRSKKKWGNWATRNNYTPIWGISAAWGLRLLGNLQRCPLACKVHQYLESTPKHQQPAHIALLPVESPYQLHGAVHVPARQFHDILWCILGKPSNFLTIPTSSNFPADPSGYSYTGQ